MATLNVPAPMAGSIKELLVAPGDEVRERQEILILESMKMEIPLESPATGKIAEILVSPRDRIEEGQVLLKLETP